MTGELLKNIYERIPNGTKRLASLLPFSLRAGGHYRGTSAMLEKSQWLPLNVLEQYQTRKLRDMLTYAYGKVSFYRQMFDSIRFDPLRFSHVDELEKLPLLTKKDVYEHYDLMVSTDFSTINGYVGHTGGTTGQPLKLFFSLKSHFEEWAFMHSQWKRAGFQPGHRRVALLGVPFKKEKEAKWKFNPLHNELQLSPRHLSSEDLSLYTDMIRKFKPRHLYGLPSALTVMAMHLINKGVTLPGIEAVLCGSENMSEEQYSLLSNAFEARVYSWYGQTEKVVLGGACEHSREYHLFPEYGYTELVDNSGKVIKEPGVVGEIVGTGFLNRAMPLIRYCTDDLAMYAAGPCSCGRAYARLERVVGRRGNDCMISTDNEKVLFSSIETQRGAFSRVRQWQFIQRQPGLVEVHIMKERGISADHLAAIEQELNGQFAGRITFVAFIADDLFRTETGKIKNFILELAVP
ncbi:MAG: AMP-binding protein [Syntrophobacteraceae bacterium]